MSKRYDQRTSTLSGIDPLCSVITFVEETLDERAGEDDVVESVPGDVGPEISTPPKKSD